MALIEDIEIRYHLEQKKMSICWNGCSDSPVPVQIKYRAWGCRQWADFETIMSRRGQVVCERASRGEQGLYSFLLECLDRDSKERHVLESIQVEHVMLGDPIRVHYEIAKDKYGVRWLTFPAIKDQLEIPEGRLCLEAGDIRYPICVPVRMQQTRLALPETLTGNVRVTCISPYDKMYLTM